jgi:hypothetical protein
MAVDYSSLFKDRFFAALEAVKATGIVTHYSSSKNPKYGYDELRIVIGTCSGTLSGDLRTYYRLSSDRRDLLRVVLGGTREALLMSGLVTDECFPADVTRKATRRVSRRCLFGVEREIKIVTAPKHGFNAFIYMARDEQDEWLARQEKAKEVEKALDALRTCVTTHQRDPAVVNRENRAAALAQHHETEARFNVGDVCVYWNPEHEAHGTKVEIVRGFGLCLLSDDDGPYIDGEGGRVSYQYGYLARKLGGKEIFFRAHELRDEDWNLRHIRLVPIPIAARRHAA